MLLDVTISDNILIIAASVVIAIAIVIFKILSQRIEIAHRLEMDNVKKEGVINEKDTYIQKIQSDMKGQAQDAAVFMFDEWKKTELNRYIKVIDEAGTEKAQALLNQWKIENEERIRKDAANRSVRNVLGKVTEHLIPFSDAMKQFNPKDIRFIGSPIDLIVFEGAEELKKDEVIIHFIEVKTGTSALSKRQQLIKDAVTNRRVQWLRVSMKDFGDDVNLALSQ
jgi:predicted Holliday junction resolvase-like endonuclease